MNDIRTCTLVLEYHSGAGERALWSVWLLNGDGTSAIQAEQPFEELGNWVRIIGPIEELSAKRIRDSLKAFFEQNGVRVIEEYAAE